MFSAIRVCARKLVSACLPAAALLVLQVSAASAHFGMIIPDANTATEDAKSTVLTLSFSHPFEMKGMDLEKPKTFSVMVDGKSTDLTGSLTPAAVMGNKAWKTSYTFARPGVYTFAMEPTPYWEPEEDCFIIHYTKTMVAAFGDESGWDEPAGLATEIVPLTRPFGNYAGNSFTGQVLLNGKPAPGAEVEVEFYNRDNQFAAPTDYHITQVVKADENGVFTFACPLAGWWGFAALNTADYQLKAPDGTMKDVELGAVLWLYFDGWKKQ